MKTVKCNDCKKQVSRTASTCPHCGAIVIDKVFTVIIFVVFAFLIWFIFF